MANIRSSTSRLVLNITTSSPAVEWPNYGSVMHQAYLGRSVGYGHELGSAAGVANPHRGTDVRPAGGVKQNLASFTWSRYANAYRQHSWSEAGECGSRGHTCFRWYSEDFTDVTQHSVEHWADTPSTILGISVDFFSLYRASHKHEWYSATYVSAVLYYWLASNPSVAHTVNYGHIMTWWTGDGNNHKNFDRSLGDGSGFVRAKLVVTLYHGMGNWHDSGDRSPLNWSPDIPICTGAHPVGISSNYWRSITNAGWGAAPAVDAATIWYKPNQSQLVLPKKHFSPSKIEGGNAWWGKIGEYKCPWFNPGIPPLYTPPPASSGSGNGDRDHEGPRDRRPGG